MPGEVTNLLSPRAPDRGHRVKGKVSGDDYGDANDTMIDNFKLLNIYENKGLNGVKKVLLVYS